MNALAKSRTFEVQYDSGTAVVEHDLAQQRKGAVWNLEQGRPGFQDRDNFTTNRVTLAEYNDAISCNETAVMGISAVNACVTLNAGTSASLPVMVTKKVPGGVDREDWDHDLNRILSESPNIDQTPLELFEFMDACVELHGNAYAEQELGSGGRVIAIHPPLLPSQAKAFRRRDGSIAYEVWENGNRREVSQDRMLHLRGFGSSPLGGMSTLSFGARAFTMAQAIQSAASATFRNGIRPSGVLQTDLALNIDERKQAEQLLQEKYQGTMRAGLPLLLDRGLKWQQLTISPEDAQMLESQRFSVEEICRFFGTPPHMIGHTDGNTNLGSSLEIQTGSWITFHVRLRIKRKEQSLTKQLLTPAERARGLRVKIDLRGLMRGDSKTRAEFYQLALQNGWMTINEVRELEGLPPVKGGDVIRLQMQNVPIDGVLNANGPAVPPPTIGE